MAKAARKKAPPPSNQAGLLIVYSSLTHTEKNSLTHSLTCALVRNFPPHSVPNQWGARKGLLRTWGGGDRVLPADWQRPTGGEKNGKEEKGEKTTQREEREAVSEEEEEKRSSGSQTSTNTHTPKHTLTHSALCLPSYLESSFPLADKSTNTTITIITSTSSAAPRWASAGKGARGSSPRWLAISIASSWERSPKVGIQKLPLPHPEVCCWVCWAQQPGGDGLKLKFAVFIAEVLMCVLRSLQIGH